MNAEYKDGFIYFKPVDDQEDIRNITGQDRALNLKHPLLQELKDEFTQVILQIEEEDDGMDDNEPYGKLYYDDEDGLAQGWIEALRFAITIINTKMKEE